MIRTFFKVLMAALLLPAAGNALADSREDFLADSTLSADNYVAYRPPVGDVLTAAPVGYTPYYISHYGRHGSRWLIGDKSYTEPVQLLQKAHDDGALTPRGELLLTQLQTVAAAARGRQEELTPLGAQQHQGIAERMVQHFPEVFRGDVIIRARSSTIIRCILSMANAQMMIKQLAPNVTIDMDASAGDQDYIRYTDRDLNAERWVKGGAADKAWHDFDSLHVDCRAFMRRVFSDEQWWRDNVRDPRRFYAEQVWKICANMQSTELRHDISLWDLFTPDERYGIWLSRNANWYIGHGPSPLNGGRQPYHQRYLLKNFLEEADSALVMAPYKGGQSVGASLRYGHESCLLPFVCLMNLNGMGRQITDLGRLEPEGWRDYEVFMMGSNVQWVFYKPTTADGAAKAEDVLVKFLINEREATLPQEVQPVTGPYYRWGDARRYLQSRLDAFEK